MELEKGRLERQLKTETELFKMYSLFLIGIITGLSSIILSKKYMELEGKALLLPGVLALIIVMVFFIGSFMRIRKMNKL